MKILQLVSGKIKEFLPIITSAGAADANKVVQTDAAGKLDSSVLPAGVGADTQTIVASEILAAGDLVNVWDDTGVAKVRKADGTTAGKEANGYVLAGFAAAASATVYFSGRISGLTGLTRGATQFLSTTAGGRTETAPSASGNIVQQLGVAVSATELDFKPQQTVEIA